MYTIDHVVKVSFDTTRSIEILKQIINGEYVSVHDLVDKFTNFFGLPSDANCANGKFYEILNNLDSSITCLVRDGVISYVKNDEGIVFVIKEYAK